MSEIITYKYYVKPNDLDRVNSLVIALSDIKELKFDYDETNLIISITREELMFLQLQKGHDIIEFIVFDYLELA